MERIKGRISRLWRRRPKGRISAAFMAAVLMLSTVLSALSPVTAYAVEQTITGTCHIEVDDPGHNNGGAAPNTTFYVTMPDGQVIHGECIDHGAYIPNSGDYSFTGTWNGTSYDIVVDSMYWPNTIWDVHPVQRPNWTGSNKYTQRVGNFTWMPSGNAQVIKVSANPSITNGNDLYSLAGAEFTFYKSDGTPVGTLTTNESGVTDTLTLPVGDYIVRETKVPEGYLAAPDQTVTIRAQQTTTLTFADPPANDPAVMLVGKYDGDKSYTEIEGNMPQGSASLDGAEFTVEYYDTLDYENYDALKESGISPTRTWVVRTDSDGYARLSENYLVTGDSFYYASNGEITLPRGTVVVYESKAPAGYNLNTDVSFQKIQEEPTSAVITYNTPQFPESVKRGGVSVQKVDSQTGMTPQGSADFANIVFEIVNNNENDVIVDGKSAAKGEVATTITTDENGYAATADDALPYGNYILREQMRDDGTANGSYLVTAEDILFTISDDGDFKKFTASDDVVRGGVEVCKRDIESGLDTPLGGAASFDGTTFEIKSLNDNPVIVGGVTYGKNAVVDTLVIKDGYACTDADTLPYGTYTLQEVKSTEGYNLTDTVYEFTITEDGAVVNPVTGGAVRNQVKRSDLEFSKKADDTADRLAGVAFKLTSVTTGESHVIVTDENGYFNSASSWNSHTVNTNGNDWALDISDGETIDSSKLDLTAGVWFGLATDGNITAADDSLGALPYDRYTIKELPCTSNKGYSLINTSVTITRHGVSYDFGTLDDVKPYISTNAYDPVDGDSSILVGSVNIADKVTYTGLAKGSQYRLVTTVVDSATGEAITVDGEAVSATTTFTAEDTAGFVVVEMTIPTYEIGGKNITVYEELYLDGGSLMAEHKDKDDIDQQLTVIEPEIGTNAKDGIDGDKSVVNDDTTTVVDEVSYKNLIPGKEYTLTGTLMVKGLDEEGNVTEEVLTDADGNPVTAQTTFTPESADGSVDVTFTFDSLELEAGTKVVAFESLYMDGYEIAVHADINDENQTVTVIKPEIGTTAKDGIDDDKYVVADTETVVVDTVGYKDLVPGKEYTLTGTLMVKGLDEEGNVTEEVLTDADGNPVTAQTTFTPESADGSVDVTFTFDSSALEGGTELVAFESLYRCGVELATHADINDEAQSVTIIRPAIATNAADGFDGDKEVVADAESTVVDTVTYTNLVPGKEYTLTGTLMVKGLDEDGNVTEEPLMANDEPVTSEVTFTPESADGSVDLTFTFDSSALDDGTKVVAFESLKRGEVELATHADINDENQTVTIRETVIGTIARDGLDGDKDVIVDTDTHVADTVAYTDVLPGSVYTMAGILMDKQSGLPILTGDGNEQYADDDVSGFVNELAALLGLDSMSEDETTDEVASDDIDMAAVAALFNENEDLVSHMVLSYQQFTPETSAGSVNIDFAFDANDVIDRLSGETKDIVVFEVLFKGSLEDTAPVVVASELDLDNDEQTVTLGPSSIGTVALDASDGDHSLMPGKDAVITDTVTYNGLIPGKEYTLKATLMDKATGEPLSVGDKHVTAEVKFTPNEQYGVIDIDLGPFDASSLEGHDLVVFEELYKQSVVDGEATDILVAEHKDINDADQTVTVTNTPPGTTVDKPGGYFGKTGGSTASVVLVIAALVVIAGALVAYGIKNRRPDGSDPEPDATISKLDDGSDR